MKTMADGIKKLDIRFIPLDSDNPYALTEPFSSENIERITEELHEKLGHLSEEIHKTKGHIRVYTQGNNVIGVPQFVNFSREVWDKLHSPHPSASEDLSELHLESSKDDYLDHDNYNDI